jgi:hypothetical protein
MKACDIVRDHRDEILEMSEHTRETGDEVAMAICGETTRRSMGSENGVVVRDCDGEQLALVHTHPEWSPVKHSREDLWTTLQMDHNEKVERTCVVGTDESPKVRCLQIDRSDMSTETYSGKVRRVFDKIAPGGTFSDEQRFMDELKECEFRL